MARFEIPDGWTAQAYRYALDPTLAQAEALLSHAGGARFAYNTMLAAVRANLDQRAAERSYGLAEADLTPGMSWSFQGLRNEWNRRKHAVAVGEDGVVVGELQRGIRQRVPGAGRSIVPTGTRPVRAPAAGHGWGFPASRRKPVRPISSRSLPARSGSSPTGIT
jgi:hypothetical protein